MKLLYNLITSVNFFAILSMAINLGSVLRYSVAKNWWNAVYWAAAFVLTFVVTYRPGK